MQTGIFTFYFPHAVDEAAERIAKLGFDCVQLNMAAPDWELTATTTAADCRRVREAFTKRGLSIAALAGYRNPIAFDQAKQKSNLDYLKLMLERAHDLGSPLVCTEAGSRHPTDDWAPAPENETPGAMALLIDRAGELAEVARRNGAVIVIEPAVGTVLDTPAKMETLSKAVSGSGLGFLADWANLLDASNFDQANEVLASMTGSWTKRIALAHLKDVCRLGSVPRERHHHVADAALYGNMEYPAPGRGDLELSRYVRHLKDLGYRGPMIIEHVAEEDVPAALEATRQAMSRV